MTNDTRTDDTNYPEGLKNKINRETAKAPWRELQPFFANGSAVFVAPGMDLVAVAATLAQDDKTQVQAWMEQGQVAPVSDEQAKTWYDTDATVWAVVVKPLVLVQPVAAE